MKTKVIDWTTLGEWVMLADKTGEQIGRLLETLETELQVASQLVSHAASVARGREYRESEDPGEGRHTECVPCTGIGCETGGHVPALHTNSPHCHADGKLAHYPEPSE